MLFVSFSSGIRALENINYTVYLCHFLGSYFDAQANMDLHLAGIYIVHVIDGGNVYHSICYRQMLN